MRYSSDPAKIDKQDGTALIAAAETAQPAVQVEARGALTFCFGSDHTPDDGRRVAETLARIVRRLGSLSPFAPAP